MGEQKRKLKTEKERGGGGGRQREYDRDFVNDKEYSFCLIKASFHVISTYFHSQQTSDQTCGYLEVQSQI